MSENAEWRGPAVGLLLIGAALGLGGVVKLSERRTSQPRPQKRSTKTRAPRLVPPPPPPPAQAPGVTQPTAPRVVVIEDGPGADLRASLLKDPDANTRAFAASLIVAEQPVSEASIRALAQALSDSDPIVRMSAADALGGVGRRARLAWAELRRACSDTDPEVKEAARRALRRISR